MEYNKRVSDMGWSATTYFNKIKNEPKDLTEQQIMKSNRIYF